MKKADLEGKTVAELKALAKKKGITLKAGSTKAGFISALAGSRGVAQKTAKPGAAAKTKAKAKPKTAAGKIAAKRTTAPKKTAARSVVARKAATKARTAATRTIAAKQPAPRGEWQLPPGQQERIEDSKYYTGIRESRGASSGGQLPPEYGEERITVLSRDPYTLFGYWEVRQERLDAERRAAGGDGKLCIRVYDVTGITFDGRNATSTFDQEVHDRVGSWYFNFARPSHCFCADIGILSKDGRFRTITRSNMVSMPRDAVSDIVDQSWTLADEEFMKLYGYPGGVPSGMSSAQIREFFAQRTKREVSLHGISSHGISSHGLFSPQGQLQKRK
ncbi:MAG: DUF4912 domain-containing protein [Nitrospirota bacterium]|nr:DUF4912 domain-containing protein [Nitrospirota bacterium]